jgi:3-oxoacyl-[acyl-carrier-protein] synthase-3
MCKSKQFNVITTKIIGTGIYEPKNYVDNSQLLERIDLESLNKRNKLGKKPETFVSDYYGINGRFIADKEESPSFMGMNAGINALSNAGIKANQVDLLIYASTSIDKSIPDTSTRVHKALGMKSTPAFSVNSTCLSFLHALNVANNFITSGQYKTILIVSSEKPSVFANPSDPKTATILGDMATAVVLQASTQESSRIITSKFSTHSELCEMIELDIGNIRHTESKPYTLKDFYFKINNSGSLIKSEPELFKKFMSMLVFSNYKYVIPHQPSAIAVSHAEEVFGKDKVFHTFQQVGNIVVSSIPYNLHKIISQGKLSRGFY